MKSSIVLFLALAVGIIQLKAQKELTKSDSISYSAGVFVANIMEQKGLTEVDMDMMIQGLKAALAGNPAINPRQAGGILNDYIQEKQQAAMVENAAAGKKFLAENAQKEGVVQLESGLQYKVLQAGTGATPASTDKVKVHYHGTLIDGTIFDSSVERGEPATFGVTQVISGWVEALQLMPTGSKWRLFIPSDLAYGSRGAGAKIKPNSALIFDVELLEIVK